MQQFVTVAKRNRKLRKNHSYGYYLYYEMKIYFAKTNENQLDVHCRIINKRKISTVIIKYKPTRTTVLK